MSFLVPVPHIFSLLRDKPRDHSLDLSTSPLFTHQNWIVPAKQGQAGIFWDQGFLICGGRTNFVDLIAVGACMHQKLGGPPSNTQALIEQRINARMVIADGKPWITGGVYTDSKWNKLMGQVSLFLYLYKVMARLISSLRKCLHFC